MYFHVKAHAFSIELYVDMMRIVPYLSGPSLLLVSLDKGDPCVVSLTGVHCFQVAVVTHMLWLCLLLL